jgi:anti-sigma factor RsiW
MTQEACGEMSLMIQAGIDGELTPAEAARVAAHVEGCSGCLATQESLIALSGRMRREARRHALPDATREALRSRIAAAPGGGLRAGEPSGRFGALVPFGLGFALAASLALAAVLPARDDGLADAVVAGHIRALQPGHLTDVPSTDQHAVKPWFDGRLDFAPPVQDFPAAGFSLAGGRLDYLGGRPVAALVYQRRQHIIDLFVWPTSGASAAGPSEGSRNGYNFARWTKGGMQFWAVSDLSAQELAMFTKLWRGE